MGNVHLAIYFDQTIILVLNKIALGQFHQYQNICHHIPITFYTFCRKKLRDVHKNSGFIFFRLGFTPTPDKY